MQRRKAIPTEFDRRSLRRLAADSKMLQTSVGDVKIHALGLTGDRQPIRFILMRPKAGSICPITQKLIASSGLDGVSAYDLQKPEHNAIHLPCQHDFTAVCLMLQWMRSGNVKCPLCNEGPVSNDVGLPPQFADARLDIYEIPQHLVVPLLLHMPFKPIPNGPAEDAARKFFGVTINKSVLVPLSEQSEEELLDLLRCVKIEGCVPTKKSNEIYERFVDWVRFDPERYRPRGCDHDFEKPLGFTLTFDVVMQLVDHVAWLSDGLVFKKYCKQVHGRSKYYYRIEEDCDEFEGLNHSVFNKGVIPSALMAQTDPRACDSL